MRHSSTSRAKKRTFSDVIWFSQSQAFRCSSAILAAIQTIDFKGNNINTDSFDSSNPLYSTNGLYPAGKSSMIRSNGDVCSDATIISSITAGNANIWGKARTGPGGTVAFGPNGYSTGGTYNDFNVIFPDVILPTASAGSARSARVMSV